MPLRLLLSNITKDCETFHHVLSKQCRWTVLFSLSIAEIYVLFALYAQNLGAWNDVSWYEKLWIVWIKNHVAPWLQAFVLRWPHGESPGGPGEWGGWLPNHGERDNLKQWQEMESQKRKRQNVIPNVFFHSIFSLPGNYFLRVRATATMLRRRRRDTPADSPANILPAGAPSSGWEYELYVTTPTVMKRIPPTSETKHS